MSITLLKTKMANSITTTYQDDVISIDDDILNSTMIGATGSSGAGYVTVTGGSSSGAGSTFAWNGAGAGTWNTTYSVGSIGTVSGNTVISGNLNIGSSQFNGSYTVTKPKLSLDVDGNVPTITTEKNKINIDELAEMITLMKSLLVAVASDEEFAKRNPALADAAHEMLLNKLKG
jgi:hypothetical protein